MPLTAHEARKLRADILDLLAQFLRLLRRKAI
jgi:hypothetical protein